MGVPDVERLVSSLGFPAALTLFALWVFYRHGLPMGRDLVNAHKAYLESTSKRVEKIDSIDDKVDGLHAKFDRLQCHAGAVKNAGV